MQRVFSEYNSFSSVSTSVTLNKKENTWFATLDLPTKLTFPIVVAVALLDILTHPLSLFVWMINLNLNADVAMSAVTPSECWPMYTWSQMSNASRLGSRDKRFCLFAIQPTIQCQWRRGHCANLLPHPSTSRWILLSLGWCFVDKNQNVTFRCSWTSNHYCLFQREILNKEKLLAPQPWNCRPLMTVFCAKYSALTVQKMW